jgi:hypothetical protein
MKYTKNGASAKGQCNIIFRSNGKTYQIKSNAINSLSTGTTTQVALRPALQQRLLLSTSRILYLR